MMIDFGKYKGKSISDVEESYLRWGAENLNNQWKDVFKSELVLRSSKKALKTHENALSKLSDRTYDPLIFGKDSTEYITNISFKDNKIYKYLSTGTVIEEDYQPWYLNINREGTKLKGPQFYNYINHVDFNEYSELSSRWDKSKWFPRSIEEGYMMLTGTTLFKNMKISEVSLHSFDIETTGVDPEDKNAKVLLISNTVKKNGTLTNRLFDIKDYDSEESMVNDWGAFVRESNCDVLIGHNIFSFDLPYLARYELNIGRDGSSLKFSEKSSKKRKDGSQSYEYHEAYCHGRSIVDSMFLSITYDIGRAFPSYGLKPIEKHLKLVDENRIEWDFDKYPARLIIDNEELWAKFREYCKQDSDSPIKMFEIMAPSFFYMNQSVPKTFQQMINEATGSQLDSMMIRSYLQDGNSIPKTSPKVEFEGAISMGIPGVYTAGRKIDIVSMYPSIMLEYDIYDKQKDPNKHLIKILEYFRNERIFNKKRFKETSDKYFDDLQGSQKIAINSLYGYLGAGYLLFNYPEGAAEVTRHGREIIQNAILWATGYSIKKDIKKTRNKGKENEENEMHWILDKKIQEGKGYSLINTDTDSITYTNKITPTKEEFKREIDEINTTLPSNIVFEDDSVYDKLIVSKAKNYIMKKNPNWCKSDDFDLNGNVKLTIKGSSFKSSNKEPALKEFQITVVNEMLGNNDLNVIKTIYKKYIEEAKNIKDISRWTTKKTYTEKVEESERANETKVMDAIKEGLDKGVLKSIQQGDKIYLYQTINGTKQKKAKGEFLFYKKTGLPIMEPNRILRLYALFNNDADSEHYEDRVKATLEILSSVLPVKEIINEDI